MNIIVAETAGFCFGVDRAVKMLEKLLEEGKRVCTLGPLIHNPIFIGELKRRGVLIADTPGEIPENYIPVIRTHGISVPLRQELESLGFDAIDATCPFVKKIQKIVDENTKDQTAAIIAGNPDHPEVIAIRSFCHGDSFVCSNFAEMQEIFTKNKNFVHRNLCLVSQTTFSVQEYEKCVNFIKKICTNAKIFDTICTATSQRQAEAKKLSLQSDAMVVVGGRNSSNTKKLFDLCNENCPTYLVETARDLDLRLFRGCRNVGITAGASTPDSLIKEVRITMSENNVETTANNEEEMSFQDALEENLKKSLNSDQKVLGTVMSISPTEIQVDIGRKQTGYVPLSEYSEDPEADPSKDLKIGDTIHLIIMKTNDAEGTIMLSKRRYDAAKNWDNIVAAYNNKDILEGKVIEILQKGVVMTYNGTRVFIPASQSSVPRNGSLEVLKGQTKEFRVIDIEMRRRRVVGSIKSVTDERRAAAAEKFWQDAFVGKKMTGVVKNLTDFAAFVDLGGVEGMIHRSELSWRRIHHPSDVVSVGDEVEVTIKGLDPEKKKISLSYRKIEDNPWEILRRDYPVGSVVDVKIVNIKSFGAFAQIFPGMDGLIHISQISDRRIEHPSDILSVGDVVKVKITDIDFEKKRVSLSIRALIESEQVSDDEEDSVDDTSDSAPIPIEEYAAAHANDEE